MNRMMNQVRDLMSARSSWTVPVAIFGIFFVFLLIAGTIVLALIPIYLKPRDIDTTLSQNQRSFNALYASNIVDGRLLTLSNTDDLSTQMLKNVPHLKNSIAIQSAQFLPGKASSSKKKRQTSDPTTTCEEATGLFGDLFTAQYTMRFPSMCENADCEQRYLKKIQNGIRKRNHRLTVRMSFTHGEIRFVQLAFCSFSTIDINVATTNPTNPSQCTADTSPYIYLLDQDSHFFRFHPTTFDVTLIGTINCSTTADPYSMALQRDGTAWTLYTDGNLYTFNIKTAQCQSTSFISEQGEPILFGMNFAIDGSSGIEKLYISSVSSNPPFRLATIDPNSLKIDIISYYERIYARAELTGTNDGRLFGLFEGTPFTIAEINQTTGEVLSNTSQNIIQYTSDSSHFAFTSYFSNFFLFVGDRAFTDIFLYDSITQTTSKKKTISNGIVGAGISTCI